MTSLYNRATPRQEQVMRIIEGAVRNAATAHPTWEFDPRLATSIAKRAAGTLTAQWRDVLAVPLVRSDSEGVDLLDSGAPGCVRHMGAPGNGLTTGSHRRSRGASHGPWRAPIAVLHRAIGAAAGEARAAGQSERAEALTDVLRLLGDVMSGPLAPKRRLKVPDTRSPPAAQ